MVLERGHLLMPALVLASTTALLLAADIPLPQEMTALGMVGVFLLWLLRRENTKSAETQVRLARLETAEAEQRHLKHEFRLRVTMALASLDLSLKQAEKCECGAMTPVVDVLTSAVESIKTFMSNGAPGGNE